MQARDTLKAGFALDEQRDGKMFAGLPELGISNGEDLKETLTNCTEPLKAIDQFQVRTELLLLFTLLTSLLVSKGNDF